MNRITVYCGSSTNLEPVFHEAAIEVGKCIASNNLELVYGGGSIGLMGTVAKTASKHGARVIGVITHKFVELEQANNDCDELIIVDTIQERRSKMIELGQAFLVLPGGIGTFEELFEVLVGRQINDHTKPIGLANVCGYFDPLLNLIEHGIQQDFMRPALRSLLYVEESPTKVLNHILTMESNQPSPEDILPMHSCSSKDEPR